jgi:hypothetical protein
MLEILVIDMQGINGKLDLKIGWVFIIIGNKENKMVEVTKPAQEQVAEYFRGKAVKPVRIFLNQGG